MNALRTGVCQGDRVSYMRATTGERTERAYAVVLERNRLSSTAIEIKVLPEGRGEPFWIPEAALTLVRLAEEC